MELGGARAVRACVRGHGLESPGISGPVMSLVKRRGARDWDPTGASRGDWRQVKDAGLLTAHALLGVLQLSRTVRTVVQII